jgi:two-component system, NtrC family, sensor kinase
MIKKLVRCCWWILGAFLYVMPVMAQWGNSNALQQKIRALKQKQGFITDTAYLAAVNQLGFLYADNYPDSAMALLTHQPEDCKAAGYPEGEFTAYKIFGNAYQTKGDFAKSLFFYQKSYQLANSEGFDKALPGIQNNIGLIYYGQGNYSPALREFYDALKGAEASHDQLVTGSILNNIATVHFFQDNMTEAESDYRKMLAIAESTADTIGIIIAYNNISEIDLERHVPRDALKNIKIASRLAAINRDPEMILGCSNTLGNVYFQLDSISKAADYFNNAVLLSGQQSNLTANTKALIGLSKVQNRQGQFKLALANALAALQMADKMGATYLLRDANEITSAIYANMGDGLTALEHYKKFKTYADSIRNTQNERTALAYKADYTFSKKELEYQRAASQQRWIIFSVLAALTTLCIIAWVINRNRKKLDQANKTLQQKNIVIEKEKANTDQALQVLQNTQSQLIQAEKMASLGEMTTGIAHEIQNPLNFVNNFSELSVELVNELKEEMEAGNNKEVLAIADSLALNVEKIAHHGKRAQRIVKGMQEHARVGTGQKEPTDLKKLIEECVRLAFQGLRVKDPDFNAGLIIQIPEKIPMVNLVPQEIGRVLLNVFNNALYAVQQQAKNVGAEYRPAINVMVMEGVECVKITVRDNGIGIPTAIKDKIMQPFFTTKPTGEGVGLGLSLSYNIVVKGHRGRFSVDSSQDRVTDFIIELPWK